MYHDTQQARNINSKPKLIKATLRTLNTDILKPYSLDLNMKKNVASKSTNDKK